MIIQMPQIEADARKLILATLREERDPAGVATTGTVPPPPLSVVATFEACVSVGFTTMRVSNNSPRAYVTTDFVLWVNGSPYLTGSGPDPINPGDQNVVINVLSYACAGQSGSAEIKVDGVSIWTGLWGAHVTYDVTINS